MKVAISIPDAIHEAAEELAGQLELSRSALYARAIEAFVKENRRLQVREALDAVYGSEPSELDPVLDRLQTDALREEG